MVYLFPRLSNIAADTLLNDYVDVLGQSVYFFDPHKLPDEVHYTATGGTRVAPNQLAEIRAALESIASNCGFRTQEIENAYAKFDREAAVYLSQCGYFLSGEALRDDVWTFIGVVMLPDVVYWRFGSSRERYLGGVRNTFQRLWVRGRLFDRGEASGDRWGIIRMLTEDAFVQIVERPVIAGDNLFAQAIAEAWIRASLTHQRSRMESIMRRAILRIRIQNEIRALSMLPMDELRTVLDAIFNEAADIVV